MSDAKKRNRQTQMLSTASALAIITGLFAASSAFAQATAPSASAAAPSANTVQEVVVTGERRTETVQKATESITAISGAQLQASGVVSLEQLADEIPGVSQKNEGPGQTEYEMRGMSSSGGSSPTVGFYLDDIALTPPAASDVDKPVVSPDLYDLNRVEVLRGPQGTLFGSGSMGGTIRVITNQPDTHAFSASAQVTGSGTQGGGANGGVNAMINVPLIDDKLALRLVGTDTYNSGWIDRVVLDNFPPTTSSETRGNVLAEAPSAVHSDANWEHTQGGRAELLWRPIDGLTVAPTIMYQKLTQGGQNQADDPPGASYEAHYQPYDVAEPSSDEFELYTLPIEYKIGNIVFNAITGYYHRISSVTQENSEDIQDYPAFAGGLSLSGIGPVIANNSTHDSQFTQEFRISSAGDAPFQWLAGVYYQNFESQFLLNSSQESAYLGGALGVTGPAPVAYISYHENLDQVAEFGEASYRLGDFKLTAGLRHYSYDTSFLTYQYGGFFSSTQAGAAPPAVGKASSSGFIPRLNLSYTPSSDLTLYTQVAQGFRPGSALPPPPTACGPLATAYQPDDVWSFEGGEKARLFDRHVTINGSVYYENWNHIQQSLADNTCGYDYSDNAGDAHIYGAELETSWRVTPEITLGNSLGYTNATLSSVTAAAAADGFTVGQRVQEVPEWTDTASLVYTHRLNEKYNIVARATNEYVGDQTTIVYTTYVVPSYDFVNLRVGLDSKQAVSAWLFMNNATNAHTPINIGETITVFVPEVNRDIVPQPRTVGVELDYAFGGR